MGRPIHKKLILPGDVATRASSLQLYVPKGYENGDLTIVGTCNTCDAVFGKGEEEDWQKHVGRCARANIDAIREEGEKRRQANTIFDEEQWDPEAAAHLRKMGERMLKEGRMVLKPNERVS